MEILIAFWYCSENHKLFCSFKQLFVEKCNRFEHPKTEAGAVGVDENVFLFGGFDHNRRANFGKNTTLGADE